MKPFADWTLAEVKKICYAQEGCFKPTKCPLLKDNGTCRVNGRPPFALDLNEKEVNVS